MGLLDNLRDRFAGGYDDYDDDYYDEEYDDLEETRGSGILGNTSRPEVESVSVYTRSGRLVSSAPSPSPAMSSAGTPTPRSASTRAQTSDGRPSASPERTSSGYVPYRGRTQSDRDMDMDAPEQPSRSSSYNSLPTVVPNSTGQLPPYIMRCKAYEDVQMVVRRVKTNQPVMMILSDTDHDVAQRILDFCFGLSMGIGGEMRAVDAKVFLLLPQGIDLSRNEIDRLLSQVM